jgi:hypothetical protein
MSEKENDVTRLLGEPTQVQIVETKEKWSWVKFAVGMLSKQFIAWSIASLILFIALFVIVRTETVILTLIIVWGVISVIWMLSEAWKKLIENGQLKIDANLGASAALKIDGAIDKIIETVKK